MKTVAARTALGDVMEQWQTLVKAAILGTERGPAVLAPSYGAFQEALGQVARQHSEPEAALLSAAAVLDGCRRAGRPVEKSPAAVLPCEAEAHPICSRRAGAFLSRMLAGEHAEILDEFLETLAQAGRLAPPESLPELLDLGRARRAIRPLLASVVGRRGVWLASLNGDWSYLAGGGDEDDWETAAGPMRLALLRRRRAADPGQALAMLQKTWNEEPPESRAEFVAAIEVGLSAADEPFLEEALGDRRKEVRSAAAELLSRITGSALCCRMTERAASLMAFEPPQKGSLLGLKRGRPAGLAVTLSSECDKAMVRDGVEAKVPVERRGKIGEKAWWLVQVLARVPPGEWLRRWNTSAETLIEAALASEEWKDGLLEAWCAAVCRHRDVAWAAALLSTGREWVVPAGGDFAERLIAVLPAEARERRIIELIGGGQDGFGQCPMNLLRGCDHAWSDALASRFVAAVEGLRVNAWRLEMLVELSRRIPRPWLDRLAKALAVQAERSESQFQKGLRELMDLCRFRHDALASVAP